MRVLMLVNWNVKYSDKLLENEQPMNYKVKGEPYWFFKYFNTIPEVDVIDTHSFHIIEKIEKYKLHFYIIQAFRAILRLNKYDLIISHGMQSGIVVALFRRIFKGKSKHLVFDIGTFNSGAESGMALKLMQYASKSIDGLIYHSGWQKFYYQRFYPWLEDKSFFIPFGIDPSTLEHIPKKKYEGFDKSTPYILCVGKSRCDWETVVRAFDGINTDIRMCFLGGFEKKYENKRNVFMLPYVSFDEMLDLIRSAKFCILPIENVRFSFGQIRLLQQMAMKKCVIIPRTISFSDYGIDRISVVFYEPESVDSCRKALKLLLENEDLIVKIGEKAHDDVYEKYTEVEMAHRIEEVMYQMKGLI